VTPANAAALYNKYRPSGDQLFRTLGVPDCNSSSCFPVPLQSFWWSAKGPYRSKEVGDPLGVEKLCLIIHVDCTLSVLYLADTQLPLGTKWVRVG
jgi:hypothetical protein